MSDRPIRDRVRARKRQAFMVRACWTLAAINFLILVTVIVVAF